MRLTFLGDVMLSKEQRELWKRLNNDDYTEAFSSLTPLLKKSDLVVANLETPLAGNKYGYTSEQFSFNSPTAFAIALKKAGVNLVTTANNHCLDRGLEGLIATLRNLDEIGLPHIGTGQSEEQPYYILKKTGICIGLTSFTYGTNAFHNHQYLSKKDKHFVNLLQEQELKNPLTRWTCESDMLAFRGLRYLCRKAHIWQMDKPVHERCENMRRTMPIYNNALDCISQCDYSFSLLHIGGQFNNEPTMFTKTICKDSMRHGISAVVSTHEHVIHCINTEFENGGFCAYSLGNLLSSLGVDEKPFDKYAEYSIGITVDVEENYKMDKSFFLIHSRRLKDGRIICEPVYDRWLHAESKAEAHKLETDMTTILNRIYQTDKDSYPMCVAYDF